MTQTFENYYIGAYWNDRQEPLVSCAMKASAIFTHLTQVNPIFTEWFELGRSRRDALRKIVRTDQHSLQSLMMGDRSKNDSSEVIFPGQGYSLYLWNGRKDGEDAANINLQCGAFGPYSVNRCLIRLPEGEETRSHIMQVSTLTDILLDIVNIFQPELGGIYLSEYNHLAPIKTRVPAIGWIMYLPVNPVTIPALPMPAQVLPLGVRGAFIILTKERFSVNNPAHVELAGQVATILDKAGLLEPVK
ncbi:MAG: Imm52 family immunity protein [Anaerolineaceae bacterium]